MCMFFYFFFFFFYCYFFFFFFFFSSRRRHTRWTGDWSSDACSSDLHHLNPKIPNYNLQRAQDGNAILQSVPRLTLRVGLRSVRLKLWDEDAARLVTWAEVKRSRSEERRVGKECGARRAPYADEKKW